jgi:S-adenosylmethionine decarboxylase
MAFNDTLFQLGMDLTRSSTTQAEVLGSPLPVSDDQPGVKFAGTHLIADLSGAKRLDDVTHIEKTLMRCVELSGGSLLHSHVHRFGPNGGVSGVAVLKEGHINVRTWPSDGEVACDVFFMGSEEGADLIVEALAQGLRAIGRQVTRHERRPPAPKSKIRRPRLIVRERAQAAA